FIFSGFDIFRPMNDLLDLHPGQWVLHILPRSHLELLLVAAAKLAHRGPLIILDCGRQYDPTIVAETLRGDAAIADRIQARFAFICSQAVRLLQTTPAGETPILVLDLLSTFDDENVKPALRQFFLESAIQNLDRLSQRAGLAVIAYPPA